MALLTHPPQGGHFYYPDGTPCHTVPKKDGGERPTRIDDARAMGLLPSATTLLKLLSAPALVSYQIERALMSCVRLYPSMTPAEQEEPEKDTFMQRCLEDSWAHKDEAAQVGTDIHGELEAWILDHNYRFQPQWEPFCLPFCDYFRENIGEVVAVEKVLADAELGVAGRTDLIAYHRLHGLTVFDWKTKKVKPYRGKKSGGFYDNHIFQLSCYARMIAREMGLEKDPRCCNLIIDMDSPGVFEKVWDATEEGEAMNQEWAWKTMECLIALYQQKNRHWPSRQGATP